MVKFFHEVLMNASFYKLIDFDALTSIDFSFIILIQSLNIVVVMAFFLNLKSDSVKWKKVKQQSKDLSKRVKK